MTELPISKFDANRILKRAAEIEGAEDGRQVTIEELRLIAGEAGFGAQAVERAIAESQMEVLPSYPRPPVQKWGLVVTRLSIIREIPVEVGADQLMRIVRLFQPYRDGAPNVNLEEREITWQDGRGLRFALTSAGGVTEVRVYLSKVLIRKGRWMGWVKTAADRLESLVLLISRQEDETAGRPRVQPAENGTQ